jgi:hypothetical protein
MVVATATTRRRDELCREIWYIVLWGDCIIVKTMNYHRLCPNLYCVCCMLVYILWQTCFGGSPSGETVKTEYIYIYKPQYICRLIEEYILLCFPINRWIYATRGYGAGWARRPVYLMNIWAYILQFHITEKYNVLYTSVLYFSIFLSVNQEMYPKSRGYTEFSVVVWIKGTNFCPK